MTGDPVTRTASTEVMVQDREGLGCATLGRRVRQGAGEVTGPTGRTGDGQVSSGIMEWRRDRAGGIPSFLPLDASIVVTVTTASTGPGPGARVDVHADRSVRRPGDRVNPGRATSRRPTPGR